MAAATSPEPTPSPPGTLNATDEWDWLANYLGDEIPNLSDHFTVDPNSDGDQNQGNDSTDQCASTTGCTSAFDISSLPMVEDPNLLSDGVGYVTEDLTMLSQGGTTMAQHADQQTSIPNLDAPALSDWLADGSIPDFLESGTYTHQEPQVYHGVALGEGFQSTSDSNIVPPLRVSSTSDNLISQMPVQDTDIHGDFMHFPGHEATSPSPLRLAPAASTSAHTSNLENAMTATTYPEISGLTERPDTQQSVSAENEAKSEKSNLGWVQYDQTSFASNSLAPKPIHSCHLPDNGRKRGRREPLTEAKRKRVAEMRKLKSCLLCRLRKKDCDSGIPCRRCLDAAMNRPVLLYCVRAPLVDLTEALIPPSLFPIITDMVPCEVMMYYAGPLEDVYPGLKLTRISYSDTEVPMQEFPLIQGIQHVEGVRLAQASKIRARGVAAIGEHSYELSLIFPAPLHSALRGNLNRWASAMVEAGLSRRMFHDLLPVCQWRVVNVIHQTYLDRAKSPILREAMKIFLLTHLRQDSVPLAIFHDHHKMYTRRSCLDDVSAWICIKPLIERLLQGLLPRLQALLLRRHRTDWPIVVGALVTLSMSADDRIFHGSPGFKTRLEGPEDGWNVLLGLYVAAYGGYHISNRRPGHGSSDSQGDRNGLKLSHRLNAWMRQEDNINKLPTFRANRTISRVLQQIASQNSYKNVQATSSPRSDYLASTLPSDDEDMANTHAPTFERILNQSSAHSKANSRETKSSTTPSPAALARAERLLCTNRVQLNKRFVVFLGQEVTTYSHYQYTPAPPIADNGDLTDDELAYSGCYANPHGLVVLCEAALRRMESSEPWD